VIEFGLYKLRTVIRSALKSDCAEEKSVERQQLLRSQSSDLQISGDVDGRCTSAGD